MQGVPAAVASNLECVSERTLFPRQHGVGSFANGGLAQPYLLKETTDSTDLGVGCCL